MTETAPDLRHLLEEALSDEDRRLDALEAHLSNLHAQRRAQAEQAAAAPPPPAESARETAPAQPAPEFEEARRLLAESGQFLRELQTRLELLETDAPAAETEPAPEPAPEPEPPTPAPLPDLPEPPPILASPPLSDWVTQPPQGSSAGSRRPAKTHDLEAVFGARGAEPAWVQRMLQGQLQVVAALERLERVASRTLSALEGWPADPSLVARAEHAERALAQAQLESSTRNQRLEALESRLNEAASAPPAGTPDLGQLVSLLRNAEQVQAAQQLRAALEQAPAAPPSAPPALVEGLREELLAMSAEHQALVEAHARLLDRMLGVFEDVS